MDLSLGFLFCSIDLYFCLCAMHLHIPIALRVSLGGPRELHLPDQGSKYSTCKVQQFGVIFPECHYFMGNVTPPTPLHNRVFLLPSPLDLLLRK